MQAPDRQAQSPPLAPATGKYTPRCDRARHQEACPAQDIGTGREMQQVAAARADKVCVESIGNRTAAARIGKDNGIGPGGRTRWWCRSTVQMRFAALIRPARRHLLSFSRLPDFSWGFFNFFLSPPAVPYCRDGRGGGRGDTSWMIICTQRLNPHKQARLTMTQSGGGKTARL